MATRTDFEERRDNLVQALREGVREGRFAPGKPLPPLRELAAQYGLAVPTVSRVMKSLMEEGYVHSLSNGGTIAGAPLAWDALFVLVLPAVPHYSPQHVAAAHGFEERIAELGANTLTLDWDTATRWHQAGELSKLRGVFHLNIPDDSPRVGDRRVARVEFGPFPVDDMITDVVYFDNVDGSRQAVHHLMRAGHRCIAYLGLHRSGEDFGEFLWSVQRETGWRQVLEEQGLNWRGLSFLPEMTPAKPHALQAAAAYQAAQGLARRGDVTAVVTTSALATAGLFQALTEANIPQNRWPAIVSFDDTAYENAHIVSVLRLSWANVGRAAAELLWERTVGKYAGASRQVKVKMSLIPRMSCRPGWSPARVPRTHEPMLIGSFSTKFD